MLIIGLTGSIGMGKSTAAQHFISRGVAVFDADREVHRLYEDEAVPLIEAAFPGTTGSDGVDRVKLGKALHGDSALFAKLERLIHPLVGDAQRKFLDVEYARGAETAVLEIPLLFETKGEEKVDVVVVVSAGNALQRERVLARPGMSVEKFEDILSRQLPDIVKRARADFVVDTSGTLDQTYQQIDMIISKLKTHEPQVFENWWRKN